MVRPGDADAAIERLRFLATAAGPVVADALAGARSDRRPRLGRQGVQMGDDVHIRVQASTNLFLRTLLPHLVASEHPARIEVAASCPPTTSSS